MSNLDSRATKKITDLTLPDKLSRLSYAQTLKLLGSNAPKLLRVGAKWDFRLDEDVYLGEDCSAFSSHWEQAKVSRRVLP